MNAPRTTWRQPAETETDLAGEVQLLRRTLRDVVALSALPSIRVDCDLPRSVRNLTDVLRTALRGLTVCVRVDLPDGSVFSTAASDGLSNSPAHRWDAEELLNAIDPDSTELVEIPKFDGRGPLNALPHPLFFDGRRIGYLVVCYKGDAHPWPSDPLLLQVAANQIALLFQRHKGQEELRHKTNQLAAYLETAAVGLDHVGPDGTILWANEAEMMMLGYSPEEYIGHHISEFHSDEPGTNDFLERLTCGQRLFGYQARLKCKDGSIKDVLIDSSVLWEDGNFVHTQCLTRDITEQKRAEQALRESNALLEGQKDAFQAAMRGCSLEASLEVLRRRVIKSTAGRARAAFYLVSPDGKALRHVVGMHEHYAKAVDGYPVSGESMACGLAVHTGQPVIARDVEQDPRWEAYRWLARQHNFRACWSFPVRTKDGPVLGTLAMYFEEPREPTPRETDLATVIAHAATVIISRHQQSAERERAEQQLRESEERFRAVLDNSTAVIYVKDCDGKYLLANRHYEKLFDTNLRALVGKTDFDLFPREVAEKLRENDLQVVRTGQPLEIEEVAPHDGGPHTYISIKFPLRRADGSIYAVAGISTDITDRKRAQVAMQRLAAIVESSDDAIISKDLNGIITSWNKGAERIFGYTAQEVIGKPVTILMPPERVNEEPGILARLRQGESIDHYQTVRQRKDGTLLDISLTVSPIKDSNGTVIGASKIARDITELIRAKEKLEQTVAERTASLREAVEQMEEFSYSVSHDLRAPLRAMSAYSGVLLEEYGDRLDETGRGYLKKIQRGSDRMTRLTQDVLAYSRVARSQAQPQAIELERLVRDIIHQYTTLQPPGAEIEILGRLPVVLGHETTLGQSVSNLLNNAVKFVAPGVKPQVRIRAERKAKQVRIWFEDNGIGIKPEHQQRIFNMFERVHPEGKYEGTGIGLTMVRKALEKMGGKAGVSSDGQHGSRFWIELLSAESR